MKYSVMVGYSEQKSTVIDQFDFIQGSSHSYYYQEHHPLDTEVVQYQMSVTFERWRKQVINDDPTFGYDQLCKFPYLKKSIEEEKSLRFPLVFFNRELRCGTGRYFTIHNFFPDIKMDAIRIFDYDVTQKSCGIDNLVRIHNMDQLLEILFSRGSFMREMEQQGYHLNIHLEDDIIVSSEVSLSADCKFPFISNPAQDQNLINEIKHIIKSTTDEPIFSVIEKIAGIPV